MLMIWSSLRDDIQEFENFEEKVAFHVLKVKDLGKLQYFLGMEITPRMQRAFVSQQRYVLDLLKET